MAACLAIFSAFLVGALVFAKTKHMGYSWLCSCAVVPAFVLISEFVIPYKGGGASMWPIALVFGGGIGTLAGGAGVLFTSWLIRKSGGNVSTTATFTGESSERKHRESDKNLH